MKVTRVHVLILLATVAYVFFSLARLDLPGLQYDETLFANAALGDVDSGTFVEWEVPLGTRNIPLMLMPYVGAPKALLYAPVFALFGGGAATVRIPVVVIGLVSLVLLYFLLRAVFDESVALVGFAVLASDPAFIFTNKLDWGPVALRLLLKTASLYLLWRWLRTGRLWALGFGAFLLGLGLYDKITFAWFLLALAVAALVCFGKELLRRFRILSASVAAAAFIAGAFPLIAYNVRIPMGTFQRHAIVKPESWFESARYRYNLFRATLDGSAVVEMVNGGDPARTTEVVRKPTGRGVDRGFQWLFRIAPLTGTAAFYLAVASAAGVCFLLRIRPDRKVLFFLLLAAAETTLIAVTPEATGAHHAACVFPFTQILIALFLVQLYRLRPVLRLPAVALAGVLLVSQLAVDLSYLKSFETTGGVGRWSDAIYRLHEFARHCGRPLLLMDWGFKNQLLALNGGKTPAEEAFVPMVDQPATEQRLHALYPYLLMPRALFVFHMPQFEGFPMLDLFQRGLRACGLEGRIAATFSQRNGRPVYVVCEAVHPEVEAHLRSGGYFQYIEAEGCALRRGGGVELRNGASGRRMLGETWGRNAGDFATFGFSVPRRVDHMRLYLRYAFESPQDRACDLRIDSNWTARLPLPWTGMQPGQQDNWAWASLELGAVEPGEHKLRLEPVRGLDYANLDALYFSDTPLQLRPLALQSRQEFEPVFDLDVLGYQDRTDVRLESESPELIAGKSVLKLRLRSLRAEAIDVQYTVDGRRMPVIYGWRLDADGTTTVPVDDSTKKGSYHFLAIRDAADPSPTAWIRVDTSVRVR